MNIWGSILASVIFLAGCGGGGGGNGGAAVGSFAISRSDINWSAAVNGQSPFSVGIVGTVNTSARLIYIYIEYTDNGVQSITGPQLDLENGTGTIVVRPKRPRDLSHGQYLDTVVIRACADEACQRQFSGSPATVNVRYTVGIPVDPGSMTLEVIEAPEQVVQPVDVAWYAGSSPWVAYVPFNETIDWLQFWPPEGATLPATLDLRVQPRPPGLYTGNFRFEVRESAQTVLDSRLVPISYRVLPLLQASNVEPYVVTDNLAADGEQRTLQISSRDPERQSGWVAESLSPWLRVLTPSGHTATENQLQVELIGDEVARLINGVTAAALRVTPDQPGTTPIDVMIDLELDRPHVATVTPYVGATNRASEVNIRGDDLAALDITGVTFGGLPATSWQLEGDSRIRAVAPPLSAGRYPVQVIGSVPGTGSSAELVITSHPPLATTAPAAPPIAFPSDTVFDPERLACHYVSATEVGTLRLIGNTWVASSRSFRSDTPNSDRHGRALELSANGRELLLLIGGSSPYLLRLDAETLAPLGEINVSLPPTSVSAANQLLRMDDGSFLVRRESGLFRLVPGTGEITSLSLAVGAFGRRLYPASRFRDLIMAGDPSINRWFAVETTDGVAARELVTSPNTRFLVRDPIRQAWLASSNLVRLIDDEGELLATIMPLSSLTHAVLTSDGNRMVALRGLPNRLDVVEVSGLPSGSSYPVLASTPTQASFSSSTNRHRPLYLTPSERDAVICDASLAQVLTLPP